MGEGLKGRGKDPLGDVCFEMFVHGYRLSLETEEWDK